VRPMQVKAGRSPNRSTLRSRIARTFGNSDGSICAGTSGGYDASQTFSSMVADYT